MSWQDKIDFDQCDLTALSEPMEARSLSRMTPGLTNTYDRDLREKAGVHTPPPPPECMGLEGEYDEYGLVRRLAQALDRQPSLAHLDTVTLVQQGSMLVLLGKVPDQRTLDAIVAVAVRLDGTRAVDASGVAVG
jgi:hypothetical protein